MVTIDVIDDEDTSTSIAPSVLTMSSSLSPEAPPGLPASLQATSSLTFDNLDAPTFACLLTATIVASICSGLTFQWLIEKGAFRKKLTDKTNQYNVIVAIASCTACLQTILCFTKAFLHNNTPLLLDLSILVTWTFMTHFSVLIVTRKVSLTDNDSERAWRRLLSWNAGMMVVTIATVVAYLGANRYFSERHLLLFQDLYYYFEPIQIGLWGIVECGLSTLFIRQMKKYFWKEVEQKGLLAMMLIAGCDLALVVLSIVVQQHVVVTAVIRGLVYTLRIRLELEVLSAMVTYIQNKRNQVVYMARKERRKQRRKRRSDAGDDNSSQGSHCSTFSVKNIRKSLHRRMKRTNIDDNHSDAEDSVGSVFDVFRRKKKRKNNNNGGGGSSNGTINDEDSVGSGSSHFSVFHRLPHATDYSNIFQTNFLNDFAAATHHTGKLFKTSFHDIKKSIQRASSAARNIPCRLEQSTKATYRNSTSSSEIPIQGMEIKVTSSDSLVKEGPDLEDLEDGMIYHYRRKDSFQLDGSSASLFETDPSGYPRPVSLFSSHDGSTLSEEAVGASDHGVLDRLSSSSHNNNNNNNHRHSPTLSDEPRPHLDSHQMERMQKIRAHLEQLSTELSVDDSESDHHPAFSIQRLRAQVEQLSHDLTLDGSDHNDLQPFRIHKLRAQVEQLSQELSVPEEEDANDVVAPQKMMQKLRAHVEWLRQESMSNSSSQHLPVDSHSSSRMVRSSMPQLRIESSMGDGSRNHHQSRLRAHSEKLRPQSCMADASNGDHPREQVLTALDRSNPSSAGSEEESSALFGIPRRSYHVKKPSDLDLPLEEAPVGDDEDSDKMPAPFGIPRIAYKTKPSTTPTPAAATDAQGLQKPPVLMRRAVSLDGHNLMMPLQPQLTPAMRGSTGSSSWVQPRRISDPREKSKSSFSFASPIHQIKETESSMDDDDDEEPEELRHALEQLENLKCL